jgi:hypothetical protein
MTSIAMKVYDLQWFTTYGMDYADAARALREDGVDTILAQNFIDPLPSSGVDQTAYLARYRDRLAEFDDLDWVEALREAGLRVLQTTATFFDPAALGQFPDARPVDALGEPDMGFDWYTGVCPTSEGYLRWKIGRLEQVVETLEPDGLFLQFTRFPGFWENWTWTPHHAFGAGDQYCFCERCRGLFQEETGIELAPGDARAQAEAILNRHGEAWVGWRSRRLVRAIERIVRESGAEERGLEIVLNTLPFPSSDFGGLDVRRTIAAQDLRLLEEVIDGFELMTYLQILNRPVAWIEDAVRDARNALSEDSRVVCTLQVAPLYTEGVHVGRNRATEIPAEQLREAGETALRAGADGLVFYHWTDFLDDEAAGGTKRSALRELAAQEVSGQ